MDSDLFQLILKKQNEWRNQYYANKKRKNIITVICNRKYKSKGNKDVHEIHKSLLQLGFLEEDAILQQRFSGELCYDSLYGK